MSPPPWSYSVWRDTPTWMYLAVGAVGAVPAAMLWPVSWRVAAAGVSISGPVIACLLLVPALLLSMWAVVWWIFAAKRLVRMRRLIRTGVLVQARVQRHHLLRGRYGHLAGVVLFLEYDVDGRTYDIKMRTTLQGVAAQARDLGRVDLAIDPRTPNAAAIVMHGRLG